MEEETKSKVEETKYKIVEKIHFPVNLLEQLIGNVKEKCERFQKQVQDNVNGMANINNFKVCFEVADMIDLITLMDLRIKAFDPDRRLVLCLEEEVND